MRGDYKFCAQFPILMIGNNKSELKSFKKAIESAFLFDDVGMVEPWHNEITGRFETVLYPILSNPGKDLYLEPAENMANTRKSHIENCKLKLQERIKIIQEGDWPKYEQT